MIDLKKAQIEFDKYVSNYDINNVGIKLKYNHSYRVMKISEEIAKSLNLSEEDISLSALIGLLHDIARFEQFKRYNTFSDGKSIDHGDFGVIILKENNFIRKFIETDEYDNIIFVAIENHNKYKPKEGLNERELLFTKIIRDADKIDIFNMSTTELFSGLENKEDIENAILDDEKVMKVKEEKLLVKTKNENEAIDRLLVNLCLAFDINYKKSMEILNKKDYINKIVDFFDYKIKDTKVRMEQIRNILNNYIQKRMI